MYRLFIDGDAPISVKAFHLPRVGDHIGIGRRHACTEARVTKIVHTVELPINSEDDAFQQEIVDVHASTKE